MGKLLYFDRRTAPAIQQADTSSRVLARTLIRNAADILRAMDEGERQVAWILEDCVDLLCEQERKRGNRIAFP